MSLEHILFYLKTHIVPRSEHYPCRL